MTKESILLSRIKAAAEQGYKQHEILSEIRLSRKQFQELLKKNNLVKTFSITTHQLIEKRPLSEIFRQDTR